MSSLTPPTPIWHQPVCLPLPTCSPTCLVRAPSSLWVSAWIVLCIKISPNHAGDFPTIHVFVVMCTQELCLYTLGNLCPDDIVKEKLLAQGIIPALANCIEVNYKICWSSELSPRTLHTVWTYLFWWCVCVCVQKQRHNLAVVEAVGFTLSQLLQTKDAAEKIIP